MSELWTEKYRPREFKEVFGQEEIVSRVEAFVKQKNMPHLLFTGPAGTGKSSLSLIIVKKLYGDDWKSNYLELNASDERGIDVVRQKIKGFARTRSLDGLFKIIFLDEADALTREAQQALRRTMEMFTQTCRFIMSCNYSSKIIEPIQSRCAVFRFKQLDNNATKKIVENIARSEGIQITADTISVLQEMSEGDCRKMVNLMQAAAVTDKNLTPGLIREISKSSRPQDVKTMMEAALRADFRIARGIMLDLMLDQSMTGIDIIKHVMEIIPEMKIDEKIKVKLIEKCGEAEFRLTEGSDEFIQLEALLASFVLASYKISGASAGSAGATGTGKQ